MTHRVRLGVNIDHVATVRNARGGVHPDPLRAAREALAAGADGITAHLREDRPNHRPRHRGASIALSPSSTAPQSRWPLLTNAGHRGSVTSPRGLSRAGAARRGDHEGVLVRAGMIAACRRWPRR